MKKVILFFVFSFVLVSISNAQWKINESFEADTLIPPGWGVYNESAFPIDPTTNWTVRDSGDAMPGLSVATAKAHTGTRSCSATWWASIDTSTARDLPPNSDVWLVTKRVNNVNTLDRLLFWATGGTASYSDSLQIWVGLIDSLPDNFTTKLATILWPVGSTYGTWTQYNYSLAEFNGFPVIWIAFRYFMDCEINGFAVQVDDVQVGNPTGITPIGTNIPDKFDLHQNYPNPFNPTTNIKFDLAKATNVNLVIFNSLGQQVATLVNEHKPAGSYVVDFNASHLASGTYYYKITTNEFTQTKKMLLVK